MKRIVCLACAIVAAASLSVSAGELRWYKGCTHAHTTNSDGDETPQRVARWYFDHGYNFLVLSDHDTITETRYLDAGPEDGFILIPGEEVTVRVQGKPVHVNGIGLASVVPAERGKTIVETLQADIDAIRAAGGVPQINHPNWIWAFADSQIAVLERVKLVEIYNINKVSNNYAAGGAPGMEGIWDRVLSRGVLLYGVVTDDAHTFTGDFLPENDHPGKGWIMVRAGELTPAAIVAALEKGDFYGTDGVMLRDIRVTDREYTVEIEPWEDAKYSTFFIGPTGAVLKEVHGLAATYAFNGNEGYVRAKVVSTTGDFAITQPVFVKR